MLGITVSCVYRILKPFQIISIFLVCIFHPIGIKFKKRMWHGHAFIKYNNQGPKVAWRNLHARALLHFRRCSDQLLLHSASGENE